jgi:hypothetical protein
MLRFKIATSFGIAVLGAAMLARIVTITPSSSELVLPVAIAAVFIIAGLWRARIFVEALKSLAKS